MITKALRPYQHDALASVPAGLNAGMNRLLWKMPTGTGKTFTFAMLLQQLQPWLAQFSGQQMMVIAHREELLDQAAATIKHANPSLMVMVEQAERRASRYADVIVASIQTLSASKFSRLTRLLSHGFNPRIVIVDEAHHAAAKTYRSALVHLGFLPPASESPDGKEDIEAATYDDVQVMTQALSGWDLVAPRDRVLLGVTATPNRSDAIGLGCVFQSIAYSYDLKQAIADEWLVPLRPWAIDTATSLDDVHMARGDFNQRELANAVNNERRNLLALASWREHALDRPTIGFTVDVAHAHAMQELFEQAGIMAAAVSGETPKEDRRLMLRQYTDGQIDVIFNCMVLTEGTDLPRTSCILHLKPTKSATLYEQMTGRGLRLFDGKTDCVVIDLVDLSRKHSLQTAPVLYGLPPSLTVKGKTLDEVDEEMSAFVEANQGFDVAAALAAGRLTLEQLGAMAKRVDPWAIPELGQFGVNRTLRWMKLGEDCYRIQYPWADGMEILEVTKDLIGKWEVVVTIKPTDRAAQKRQRTIAVQLLDQEAAAKCAESFVERERRSVMKLKDNAAPWRARPCSQKQRDVLHRLGVKQIPSGCNMGRASDMIDMAMARKGRR